MGTIVDKLKLGVIGVGRMGERHCRVYTSMPQTELVGISDLSEERGYTMQERYFTRYFKDFQTMLPLVDAVSIVTTTPGHYPIGMECLRQGKHLLIEKPIALNLTEAREMVALARRNGCLLMVGHIERYNPAFLELEHFLDTLPSQETIALNVRRLSPFDNSLTDVDVISDLMIHDLDLTLKIMGRLPDAVEAFGRRVFTKSIDHAVANLYYHHGPVVSLTASRVTQQKVRSIELTTNDSFVQADLLHKSLSIHRRFVPHYSNQDSPRYRQEGFIEQIFVPNAEPLQLELLDFVQSVQNKAQPKVSGEDGIVALGLALEIRDKIETRCDEKPYSQETSEVWRKLETPVVVAN